MSWKHLSPWFKNKGTRCKIVTFGMAHNACMFSKPCHRRELETTTHMHPCWYNSMRTPKMWTLPGHVMFPHDYHDPHSQPPFTITEHVPHVYWCHLLQQFDFGKRLLQLATSGPSVHNALMFRNHLYGNTGKFYENKMPCFNTTSP